MTSRTAKKAVARGAGEAGTPESREDNYGLTAIKAKYKRGGRVEGEKAKKRLDMPHRAKGGRVGRGKTTVNVIMGGGAQQPPAPQPMPVPVPAPPPAMPPHPMGAPMPPMGGAPGGMPVPPMGAGAQMMGRARGGRVDKSVKMDAGAGSGEGRREKITRYGKNAGSVH